MTPPLAPTASELVAFAAPRLSPGDPTAGTALGLPCGPIALMHDDLCTGTRIVTIVYKVAPAKLWAEVGPDTPFQGSEVDLRDGYVHLSTGGQVRDTVRLHFRGSRDLVLVAVDSARLGEALRWEPSRGGDLFPHLYGLLPLAAVLWVRPLMCGPDGVPQIPEDVR